jgi:thiosulfate dehydrogenase [quinone] large subunit
MDEQTRIAFLLPLRLFCGWVFLNAGLGKLAGGWLVKPELTTTLLGWIREGKPYSFYVPFLRAVVLPHAHGFAYLISFGELLVGAALLAGLFSRLAAFGGLLLVFNFLLARGDGIGVNGTMPFVVMTLTLMLTGPGRSLGLDAALRGRLPRWLA